ncbi:hypothetical protein PHMEG_00011609 [Phytophthora megakarya]|uniref:Retrotransposon gag domain-containing protein n=1 Tax=Phytophthora megakarya TaxID=4795 RepID=A0A225WCW1_9STRA|nr:hypothetical protein PHMEG_00011609 [Phytophthora megakarya]
MGDPPVLRKHMVPSEVKTLYATQTQAALRDLDETKMNVAGTAAAKAATTTAVKTEATADETGSAKEGIAEGRLKKKSTSPSQRPEKHSPTDDEPSDDDNDSDKDSSSLEDLASVTQPLAAERAGLEKFQSLAVMGRWSDHAKVYYCKLKLSSVVRDWRGNLDESVCRSWKRFVKAFREEYCKAKTPDSEKSETSREFYYKLNKTACKADIDIKSTDIARDRHMKVFIKKLKDTQLRSTLQGQRVRSLKNLEHILKQHEESWWSDDRAHPLKGDDGKSDSAFGNRQRQKINNRAYNVDEDEVFESDDEQQTMFDQGIEGAHQKVSFGEPVFDRAVDGLTEDIPDGNMMLRKQDATSEIYRILENSGWRPPNSEYRSPPKTDFGKPQQMRHCNSCRGGGRTPRNSTGRIWNATDVTRRDILLSIARLILVRSVTNFITASVMD